MLHLRGNQLSALPGSIGSLTSLTVLHLGGNQLELPEEILGQAPAQILEYYSRTIQGSRPLHEAKLILVGFGEVRKTSLVNRMIHGTFDPGETKTDGIKITTWPLSLKGESIRLHVWDFGGQEIMHATHQFFLTERSLYLLVLNGRQGREEADAEYWLRLIESFGADSPVIVVFNKTTMHPCSVNRRGLRAKFPAIREFVETDCESGTGIAELQRTIERETDRLEHLRASFPASWFRIKDRLSSLKENYLDYEQFRDICAELGEADEKSQDSLAGFLHTLGIALNYKDDPRLRDKHVLNPHWVTNGIYTVLNSSEATGQKGEIRHADLDRILDSARYPPGMHSFLIDLMKKFELCFEFTDRADCYLVPELLDKEQPIQVDRFRTDECLSFEYRYPIVPEGIIPRFIVRTHILGEADPPWRTGVVLRFEGCQALVSADLQARRVRVAVRGPEPQSKRRLLAVIRSHFEAIHSNFNFDPDEYVVPSEHPDAFVPYSDLIAWEADGRTEYVIRSDGKPVGLSVSDLLNGVDIEGSRRSGERDPIRPV